MTQPVKIDRSSKNQTLQDAVDCPKLTCEKPDPGLKKTACKLNTSTQACHKSKEEKRDGLNNWVPGI